MDHNERELARREDREFFDRWPDREYRLRRAWRCEYDGERPAGFEAFSILHRQDVAHWWAHTVFGAPIIFETSLSDAQIREMLQTLAGNHKAMLTAQ